MAKHPVFPMWVTDYLADTSHLDATEHGIYHLLLYRYWLTDGRALPDDMAFLRRVTHCRSAAKVRSILEQFWQLSTGEGWHHRRAQREFRVTRERSCMQSERAKKRWKINEDTNAAAYAVAMPPSPSPDPEKERKEKQEKEKKEKKAAKPRFKKPTPQEVQAYLGERGITTFTGQEFVDSNDAKGWVVGKNRTPMKDWRAAVRTWEKNKPRRGNGAGGKQSFQEMVESLGRQLGVQARPGEGYDVYYDRLRAMQQRPH